MASSSGNDDSDVASRAQELLAGSRAEILCALDQGEGDPWTLKSRSRDSSCGEARVYTANATGDGAACTRFKLVGRVPCAPEAAYDLLCDFSKRMAWDSTLSMGEIVRDFGTAHAAAAGEGEGEGVAGASGGGATMPAGDVKFNGIVRYRTNPAAGGMVSPREFVDCRGMEILPGGHVLSYMRSVSPELARALGMEAPAAQHVRGHNFSGGLHCALDTDDTAAGGGGGGDVHVGGDSIFSGMARGNQPVQSKVTMVTHTDAGGSLPKWLTNKATSSTLLNILRGLQAHLRSQQQ